jgi:ATP-dependent RNA helicase RhlE
MSFDSLGLAPELLQAVRSLGFDRPTPIQVEAIPPALEGRDVLGCAMTGSGKTAAFVLPLLQRLGAGSSNGSGTRPRGRTRALILAPTRELAGQVEAHLRDLGRRSPLRSAAIFGGVAMGPQERALRSGVDVVVATPGRLLDHLRQPWASLRSVEILVLDEADRMLDMGFLPDIRRILGHLPEQRQTLFFSATMPPQIRTLARDLLRDPAIISHQRTATPASGITQSAYAVPANLKSSLLVELMRRGEIRSAIAFTRTKHRANRLADFLARHGVSAGRIHGNRSQAQRDRALADFKAGRFPLLVATDVAARGIDIEALSHVINFDVPGSVEDYVHRVGRTARAEARGDAWLFFSPEEENDLRSIERSLRLSLPRLTLQGFDYAQRAANLEIPLAQRLAEMRRQRSAGRRPAARGFGGATAGRRAAAPPSAGRRFQRRRLAS